MIEKYQVVNIYRSIMKKLLHEGDLRKQRVVNELNDFYDGATHLPIFYPKHYERKQENTTPFLYNSNISDIEQDLRTLEEALFDTMEIEDHMKDNIANELDAIRTRIARLSRKLDISTNNTVDGIDLIPEYVDPDETTTVIMQDSDNISSGELMEIFRRFIAPNEISYSVISDHVSHSSNGDLELLSKSNPESVTITVKTNEPIRTSIRIKMSTTQDFGGLYMRSTDPQSYLINSNISDQTYGLYDNVIIYNDKDIYSNVIVDMSKDSYDKIIKDKFIYYFKIDIISLYRKVYDKASVFTTTNIDIDKPYIRLNGEVSGEAKASVSVNDSDYYDIDINDIVGLKTVNSITTISSSEQDNNAIMKLGTLDFTPDPNNIEIIGPVGMYKLISGRYDSFIELYRKQRVTFNVNCIVKNQYNSSNIQAGTELLLNKGIYSISIDENYQNDSDEIFSITDGDYEIRDINTYKQMSISNLESTSLPAYVYIIDSSNNLYISKASLLSYYKDSNGNMVSSGYKETADNLRINAYTNGTNQVKIRILVTENSSVNNISLETLKSGNKR